mmetsp:Transcript_48695/g.137680  ORF Transcript_48695/g.137680 Transcript_48695/m.137680 type:complete len:153 (-) Transcript_48695:92-550(-)
MSSGAVSSPFHVPALLAVLAALLTGAARGTRPEILAADGSDPDSKEHFKHAEKNAEELKEAISKVEAQRKVASEKAQVVDTKMAQYAATVTALKETLENVNKQEEAYNSEMFHHFNDGEAFRLHVFSVFNESEAKTGKTTEKEKEKEPEKKD